VRALGLDMKYLDEMYATLEGEGLPVENFPQSNERMWAGRGESAAGDPHGQALRARRRPDPDGARHGRGREGRRRGQFKLVKSKGNGPPIDACVALAMANALEQTPSCRLGGDLLRNPFKRESKSYDTLPEGCGSRSWRRATRGDFRSPPRRRSASPRSWRSSA
jgi:hypothetical protein